MQEYREFWAKARPPGGPELKYDELVALVYETLPCEVELTLGPRKVDANG